jgi:hypothetical protein
MPSHSLVSQRGRLDSARMRRQLGIITSPRPGLSSSILALVVLRKPICPQETALIKHSGIAGLQSVGSQHLRVFIGQLREKLESDLVEPRYLSTERRVGERFEPGTDFYDFFISALRDHYPWRIQIVVVQQGWRHHGCVSSIEQFGRSVLRFHLIGSLARYP